MFFDVPDRVILDRLAHRRGAEARADDSVTVQEERLRVYRKQTEPLIGYYQDREILVRIEASQSVEEIQARVLELLKC